MRIALSSIVCLLEICKKARQNRVKICKEDFQTAPDKGYCATQNTWYYRYKLHGACTADNVFKSIDITKAIKMVKSPKSGTYTFVDTITTPEQVNDWLSKQK